MFIVFLLFVGCSAFRQETPLKADFTWSQAPGEDDLAIQFVDKSIIPNPSEIVVYEWDFGDGGTSTEQNPLHTFSASGTYQVSLTVTIPKPESDTASRAVTVPLTTLQPGGIFFGEDGVALAAPEGALEEGIEIFVEKIDDPRSNVSFPGYLERSTVVGNFYQITASDDVKTPKLNFLLLGLPVPEGVSPENLAIASLSPPNMIIDDRPEEIPFERWGFLHGVYDPESGLFGTLLPFVGTEPQVFVLIEGGFTIDLDVENSKVIQSQDLISIDFDGFFVYCVGFEPGECTPTHIQNTENALLEAYEAYVDTLGYTDPLLRFVITEANFSWFPPSFSVLFEYEYQLKKGNANGWYNSNLRTAGTTYPGHPVAPNPITAHHELFHSLQYGYSAYFNNREERVFGVVEGTAVASELSLSVLSRSDRPLEGRKPLEVDVPLFQRTAPLRAGTNDYRTQDFWLFVGRKMEPLNQQVDFLIPFFEKGGLREDVDKVLREEGTFSSLSDAYWQWAKNQAFEKEIILGLDNDGLNVPHGEPGTWSGHGSLTKINYHPLNYENISPTTFNLTPLTSKVFETTFEKEKYPYSTTIELGPRPDIEWIVYLVDNETGVAKDNYEPSNGAYSIFVDGNDDTTAYILVSNTNMDTAVNNIEITFSAPIDSHHISNISMLPQSPAIIPVSEHLTFTYDYQTFQPEGVLIFGRPFTKGGLSHDYSAHGSIIHPIGEGTGSGFFTLNSEGSVDQVRFRMWDAEQENLLLELFVEVDYYFAENSITNIILSPPTPYDLYTGDQVNFTFDYSTAESDGVRIFGRPFTEGQLSNDYFAHGSIIYPGGKGEGSGYFGLDSPGTVDQIRFRMYDADQNNILLEFFIPVDYTFNP